MSLQRCLVFFESCHFNFLSQSFPYGHGITGKHCRMEQAIIYYLHAPCFNQNGVYINPSHQNLSCLPKADSIGWLTLNAVPGVLHPLTSCAVLQKAHPWYESLALCYSVYSAGTPLCTQVHVWYTSCTTLPLCSCPVAEQGLGHCSEAPFLSLCLFCSDGTGCPSTLQLLLLQYLLQYLVALCPCFSKTGK